MSGSYKSRNGGDVERVVVTGLEPSTRKGYWRVKFLCSHKPSFWAAVELMRNQRDNLFVDGAWELPTDSVVKAAQVWPELRRFAQLTMKPAPDGLSVAPRPAAAESRPSIPPAVESAYNALYVQPGAPPYVVTAAFRQLSKVLHPDTGGTNEAMRALLEAYAIALDWADRHHGRIS